MLYELTEQSWGGGSHVLTGLTTQLTQSVLGFTPGRFQFLNILNVFKCQ